MKPESLLGDKINNIIDGFLKKESDPITKILIVYNNFSSFSKLKLPNHVAVMYIEKDTDKVCEVIDL